MADSSCFFIDSNPFVVTRPLRYNCLASLIMRFSRFFSVVFFILCASNQGVSCICDDLCIEVQADPGV